MPCCRQVLGEALGQLLEKIPAMTVQTKPVRPQHQATWGRISVHPELVFACFSQFLAISFPSAAGPYLRQSNPRLFSCVKMTRACGSLGRSTSSISPKRSSSTNSSVCCTTSQDVFIDPRALTDSPAIVRIRAVPPRHPTLQGGIPCACGDRHVGRTCRIARVTRWKRGGVLLPFPYAGFQSIGHISLPNACNLCSTR